MRRMLVVSDFYAPHWTGVSKSIVGLVTEIGRTTPVTVLTVQFDKKLRTRTTEGNISIHRVPYVSRFSRTYLAPALLFELIFQIPKHDIILINSPCTYVAPAAIVAKLLGKRLAIFHQGDLILPKKTQTNRFLEWAFDIMTHTGCMLADRLATYTADYASHSRILARYKAKTIPFIPPLLYPQPSAKKSPKPEWQRIVDAKRRSGHLIIGCAGRFVAEKGLDTLFEALTILRNNRSRKIHVVYAGASMAYENYLERYRNLLEELADTITFTGLLHDGSLGRFYESIDVFALPSRSECFGLVQAEALHFDVPIIVSDIPGARQLTRTFGCGTVVTANNAQALAEAIESFKRSSMVKAGVAHAQNYLASLDHQEALRHFLGMST